LACLVRPEGVGITGAGVVEVEGVGNNRYCTLQCLQYLLYLRSSVLKIVDIVVRVPPQCRAPGIMDAKFM